MRYLKATFVAGSDQQKRGVIGAHANSYAASGDAGRSMKAIDYCIGRRGKSSLITRERKEEFISILNDAEFNTQHDVDIMNGCFV